MSNKLLTIDDGPAILSKYLTVLDDEVERILSLPKKDRTPGDIKITISAATFLVTMNKADAQQMQQIRDTIKSNIGTVGPLSLPKQYAVAELIKST